MNITHRPVLLAEAVTAIVGGPLIQNQNATNPILVIDGTFGRGGHTQALLKELNPNARMISFDKDLDAIAVAQKINDPRLKIVHDSFAHMDHSSLRIFLVTDCICCFKSIFCCLRLSESSCYALCSIASKTFGS